VKNNCLLLFLLFANVLSAQLWLVDPLEAIYPDQNDLHKYSKEWKADFAMNGIADVHILIKTAIGETVTLSASLNGQDLDLSAWNQLIAVPVEENTGLDSRTEQFTNQLNPHVIRRAPFHVFEVIQPLSGNKIKTSSNFTALHLSIPLEQLGAPGTYEVNIKVDSKILSEKGRFKIRIHPAHLPQLKESRFFYTNWFNLSKMEAQHKLERWSKPWFEMLEKYAQLMAHGRQNCIIIPGELIRYENEKFILEEEKMLRFIEVFRRKGFQYFESPHLLNRGENDDWGNPEFTIALTKRGYYSAEGKKDIETLVKLIQDFAKNNGLTENWLQHIADEPTEVNAACYRDVVSQAKNIFPEIQIMEATNNRDSLVGAIDIWCPLINDFQENESFFRQREKKGEKVLVYSCLIPGGPWLNRTLDMERLRQVYFGWGAAHYQTGGYLHWGLNQYYANPFEQSVIKHPSPIASANNYLPAGDTHVVYPGKSGPLSSIRFEAHRIGIEDYEMLFDLKQQNPKRAKKLVGKLFQSYTDYNLNLKDYRKTRKKLIKSLK